MTKRFNSTIIITALCTSCALIAFARYEAFAKVSAAVFYVAAAVICLLPVVYALLRHKSCTAKMPNVG
jgi:hypothetical protein